MSGECTSFSLFVFFFFQLSYCLLITLSLHFLRSQCVLFFSAPKDMSVFLSCALCVFVWEILLMGKKHPFFPGDLSITPHCYSSSTAHLDRLLWHILTSQYPKHPQIQVQKGTVLRDMRGGRDRGGNGPEADGQTRDERMERERKRSAISHRFQRQHIIKHFPLGKPAECKHELAAHAYSVNKAKRMHGSPLIEHHRATLSPSHSFSLLFPPTHLIMGFTSTTQTRASAKKNKKNIWK